MKRSATHRKVTRRRGSPAPAAAAKRGKKSPPKSAAKRRGKSPAAPAGKARAPRAVDTVEVLYALQPSGKRGQYASDTGRFPLARPTTTKLAEALTWKDRSGPSQHMRRRPDLKEAGFIAVRLEVRAIPSPNSPAAGQRVVVSEQLEQLAQETAAADAKAEAAK